MLFSHHLPPITYHLSLNNFIELCYHSYMISFKDFLNHFLSIFFPYRCHFCKNSCDFGVVLCDECKEKLRKAVHKPELVQDTIGNFNIYTISSYDDFTSDIVKIIKYRPSKRLACTLGEICSEKADLKSFFKKDDVIIPVPMQEKRLEERGFNQAWVLAEIYAERVGCYFSPVLIRSRYTKPQASCDESERNTNLEMVLCLLKNYLMSYQKLNKNYFIISFYCLIKFKYV